MVNHDGGLHEPPSSNDDVQYRFLKDLLESDDEDCDDCDNDFNDFLVPKWIFTGAMLWNQWCERKAGAMDWEQNAVSGPKKSYFRT